MHAIAGMAGLLALAWARYGHRIVNLKDGWVVSDEKN